MNTASIHSHRARLLFACLLAAIRLAHGHGPVHERIALLDAEIAAKPGASGLRVARAGLHLEHRDFEAVLRDLERAEQMGSDMAAVPLLRARALSGLTRHGDALAVLHKHLASDPRSVAGYAVRAELLSELERYDEAADDYGKAIAHADPPTVEHFLGRSRALENSGREKEAMACLQKGLERLPASRPLRIAAFEAAARMKRHGEALALLQRLLAESPRPERWLARKGTILLEQGRPAAAQESYHQALAAIERLPRRHRNTPAIQTLERQVRAALR